MTKILVTGANGFVGSALCATLAERNVAYTAAVRKDARAIHAIAVGELDASTDWSPALAGCTCVVHLAARVHVMHDVSSDPLAEFRRVNVDATINLARQALDAGIKRFVFVSSVKVNGEETTDKPFTAFDSPAPRDPYGQSKLEAEVALQALARETGLELVIVRPPLVYGPGVRANFHSLMKLVRLGLPLPLGAIDNRRSMVALDNLVDLLILCCGHPAASGQVFMVSDNDDVGITELLRRLASAMRRRSLLLPVPAAWLAAGARLMRKSAAADRLLGSLQVDVTHTMQTLSWKPVSSMQAALEKTVAPFRR
ncbi:3 beta-hydroxysteroid dehydrogenase/Delta 5--_4-isomerase [Janthinobacterium sp. KBS0711]|uniref:UDP-glucose 4-epimerase family protein n=1 Tax=Janthinobacterium sp. KBS0711 TaxID=1649647 RepID=UPI00062823DD|nr:SDR family oxidoreductase [Janthinobacterium sp. KBS0711]KKO61599.1 3 beta-hydroxysteroid dehydrogenase/Delta 5-->4-isomerase [Janthinobacterium sp. KBS0711]TSD73791.1 SDR family oxidoreductase [Janthinobacterium sp. KBS0711]